MKTDGAVLAQAVQDRFQVEAAADYIGLSTSTLNKMRGEGRGPRFMRLGGRIFYRRADLDVFLEASLVETQDSRGAA